MEWQLVGALIIGSLIVLVVLGIPIAISLGVVSFTFLVINVGLSGTLSTLASELVDYWMNYTMLALPLFIVMGEFLFAGGVIQDLFEFASKWLRRIPGGLAMVSIGTGSLFGALSGSSLASVATIGVLSGPEMIKRGYSKSLVAGAISGAGGLAMLIPPSTMAVLYAVLAETSAGRQLMAGLIPGIILALIFGAIIVLWVRLKPGAAPAEPPVPWKERLAIAKKLILPAIVAVVVLGSIYTGVTTATEAAAIGALMGILVAVGYRRIKPRVAMDTSIAAMRTTAFIMLIAIGGKLLSWTLNYHLVPQNLTMLIAELNVNRYVIIVLIQVLLIVLGMFIDPVSIYVITVPIFIPILEVLQFDPIWFGVLMVVNMEMALITPPLGFSLYIIHGILKEHVTLGDVLKGSLVFAMGDALCLGFLIAFPGLATWIPNMMQAR